jgi:hypothetical protein
MLFRIFLIELDIRSHYSQYTHRTTNFGNIRIIYLEAGFPTVKLAVATENSSASSLTGDKF